MAKQDPGKPVPRRTVLRALGTAFGAAVVAGVPGRTDAGVAGEAPGEAADLSGGLAVVERVRRSTVTARLEASDEVVELQARDFPPDWDFQVGDRVAVMDLPGEDAPVVLPFVVTTRAARPEFLADDTVAFGDVQAGVTNRSVQAALREATAEPGRGPYHGLLVENSFDDGLTAFGVVGHQEAW